MDSKVNEVALMPRDGPQCEPTKIRIVHVGAGAAGILFAHKIRQVLQNFELVIYEKNPIAGGTWYENRYPGCACDVPAHTYTFPFEPNPSWSGFYSSAREIQQYMLDTAKKWNVDEFTQYNTELLSAAWDDPKGRWNLRLRSSSGAESTDWCNVLVNGSGVVNKWKWPAIEGLHSFGGNLIHSANWDEDLDWGEKRVAVLGSGSSSIQMVPQLGKTAKSMVVFIRNPTFVGPLLSVSLPNTEADSDAKDPAVNSRHKYTEKEKQKFRDDPEYHLKYRRTIESSANAGFPIFIRGSPHNLGFKAFWRAGMEAKLAANEELKNFLIPSWSPGCRRLSPGDGYLETLLQDNVTVCRSEIVKVTKEGIIAADGSTFEVDIIACATGFNVQYLPHFKIVGCNDQVMQDQKEPNVYASVACPGFPNYFVVNNTFVQQQDLHADYVDYFSGDRGNWGQGCALHSHEVQIEYILKCCKKLQEDRIKSMMPRIDVTTALNDYMDSWHRERSIWAEDCRSWYKDNRPNGRVHIWAGSLMHHIKFMKQPRFEHYEMTHLDSNMFAFLGNGFTITETRCAKEGTPLPVSYVRNHESEPWDIE